MTWLRYSAGLQLPRHAHDGNGNGPALILLCCGCRNDATGLEQGQWRADLLFKGCGAWACDVNCLALNWFMVRFGLKRMHIIPILFCILRAAFSLQLCR